MKKMKYEKQQQQQQPSNTKKFQAQEKKNYYFTMSLKPCFFFRHHICTNTPSRNFFFVLFWHCCTYMYILAVGVVNFFSFRFIRRETEKHFSLEIFCCSKLYTHRTYQCVYLVAVKWTQNQKKHTHTRIVYKHRFYPSHRNLFFIY